MKTKSKLSQMFNNIMGTEPTVFKCTQCSWKGNKPVIRGVQYPFANVCPKCYSRVEVLTMF